MTTTYMIMEDRVKQLNPAGSCFYANSLPRAALSKKIKEIIINKKKNKEVIRAKQTKFYTKMCQRT